MGDRKRKSSTKKKRDRRRNRRRPRFIKLRRKYDCTAAIVRMPLKQCNLINESISSVIPDASINNISAIASLLSTLFAESSCL